MSKHLDSGASTWSSWIPHIRGLHLAVVGALTLFGSPAHAQDRGARPDNPSTEEAGPIPQDRLWYTNATYGRVNPLGFTDLFRMGWRRRLSTKKHILLSDTYTFLAGAVAVTPAYVRTGAYFEAQPLAILRVFGDVAFVQYYGTFDQIISWENPDSDYSDPLLADLGDAGAAQATSGWVATTGATLQAKAGPIAVRNTLQFTRYDLDLPEDQPIFYDQFSDRGVTNRSWVAINDLDVLALVGKLTAGVRYTYTDGVADGPGDSPNTLAHHRVGPLLAYKFAQHDSGTAFNEPTLFLLTQWWLAHPYRTGEVQPQGLPLIALGFAFNGDLWVSRD